MVLHGGNPASDLRVQEDSIKPSSSLFDISVAEDWQCDVPPRNSTASRAEDEVSNVEGLPGRSQSANSCMHCLPDVLRVSETGRGGRATQGAVRGCSPQLTAEQDAFNGFRHSRSSSLDRSCDTLSAGDANSESTCSPAVSPSRKEFEDLKKLTATQTSKDSVANGSLCRCAAREGSKNCAADISPPASTQLQGSLSSSTIDSLDDSPTSGVAELVCPSDWTARQLDLGARGLSQLRSMTRAELRWWMRNRFCAAFIVTLQYSNHYLLFVLLGLPWVLLDAEKVALVYCLYTALYFTMLWSRAEQDGSQEFPAFKTWFTSWMYKASIMHFGGGITLFRDAAEPLPASEKYIFSYHPHGLMPAMMSWISWSYAWGQLLPGIRPVGLIATAVFRVPILRNLVLWGGLRDVSKRSFVKALRERGSVLFCPGGQAELALHLPSHKKRVLLSGRKTGFIRVALEAGASLVPVAVFGEPQLLDNLVDFPAAQRFTYKLLGFPIPFIPVGLCGFLPVPKKGKVAMVIGKPFDPRTFKAGPDATAEDIEVIRHAYYSEVLGLYERYKEQLGYQDWSFSIDHRT